jgi:N4-gp56 family major capsid protein
MAEIGFTEVSATTQDVVSSIVQETLKEKAKLMPTIADYSQFASKGTNRVPVPRRTQFSAADKTENTDLTAQEITFAADIIDISLHKAIFAKLEDIADIKAVPNVQAEIVQEMANEVALQFDRDVITELKLASTAAPDHLVDYVDGAGDTLALADIANARALLNRQNVPMADRYMMISPEKEKNLLNIENFISAEKYASREALLEGEIGRIFGFSVMVHNELSDLESLFWHKSAVGYAMSLNPSFEQDRDLKSASTEYLLQNLYGVQVLDSGKRQVFINGTGA